jgi:hypothetical protein
MAWTPLALPTKSNKSRLGFEGSARLINAYVESTGQDAKGTYAIYATEGLDTSFTPVTGKVWGMIATESYLYGVTGTTLWAIDTVGAVTEILTLSAEGPVTFARNRRSPATQVGLVTAADNRYYTIEGVVGTLNTDPDLAGTPTSIAVKDGYFIITTNFNRFFITGEDDATSISALDFGKAQRSPDEILRVMPTETEIALFGSESIEWHQNNPSEIASFPFVPVQSIDVGLLAPQAVVKLDREIIWLASDGTVKRMVGYGGEVISNPDVQRAVGEVEDKTTISAFAWHAKSIGHSFVAFTCPQWTWVYDLREGSWAERQSYGVDDWRVSAVAEWQGRVLAGDNATGELYDMSGEFMDEGGSPLVMTVQTAPSDAFPYPVLAHGLALDVVPGVGRPGRPQDADPHVLMSYSVDGGRTWSTERRASVGSGGNTNARAKWLRLGMIRRNGRTWRFRMSANVSRCIQGAALDVERLG